MKQHEAVIKVMDKNGGFATLGHLYQNVLKIKDCKWNTKTPYASIRRIVQNDKFFFKIKPGLWALKSHKNKLPFNFSSKKNVSETQGKEFTHSYYQGLLIEIGNLKKYETFVPNQDKNKNFLGKKLFDTTSMNIIYQFSYEQFVKKVQTIDVSWFNSRKMPSFLFEVEHSSNIQNSLIKFVELQDFNVRFFIIADKVRQKEFEIKKDLIAFEPIKERIQFIDYDKLSSWHAKTFEISIIESNYEF